MSEQYAEFKCLRCNIVVTVTGMKATYGPGKHDTGQCSGDLSSAKDHYWQRIRSYKQ